LLFWANPITESVAKGPHRKPWVFWGTKRRVRLKRITLCAPSKRLKTIRSVEPQSREKKRKPSGSGQMNRFDGGPVQVDTTSLIDGGWGKKKTEGKRFKNNGDLWERGQD